MNTPVQSQQQNAQSFQTSILIVTLFILSLLFLGGCSSTPSLSNSVSATTDRNDVATQPNTLILYDWEDDIPLTVIEKFENEFGIDVDYQTYVAQEDALEDLKAGKQYDVVVLDNAYITGAVRNDLLQPLDRALIPNFKNIGPQYRDLAHDKDNAYSVPYSWGMIGLGVRTDLVASPIFSWNDLWNPLHSQAIGMWGDEPRIMLGIALLSLGYSANSEEPAELNAALDKLQRLREGMVLLDEQAYDDPIEPLVDGTVTAAIAWPQEVGIAQEDQPLVEYVVPSEGALMWGDNLIIPSSSRNPQGAHTFINFLLRPEISAEITNYNEYASSNSAALTKIDAEIRNDDTIYPPEHILMRSEILLPLSETGQQLHDEVWAQFMPAIAR